MDTRGNMESAALTKDGLAYLTNRVEDHTYQLRYWPPYYKDMLMCNHLYYTGRFQLTIFLLGNRLSPVTIAQWYLGRNQLKNAAAKQQEHRAVLSDVLVPLVRAHGARQDLLQGARRSSGLALL